MKEIGTHKNIVNFLGACTIQGEDHNKNKAVIHSYLFARLKVTISFNSLQMWHLQYCLPSSSSMQEPLVLTRFI